MSQNSGTKTLTAILIGVHAADILDDELQPAVEQFRPPLHLDEIAGVEFLAQPGRLGEDSRTHQPGAVLQGYRDKQLSASTVPDVLLCAEEEPPPLQF